MDFLKDFAWEGNSLVLCESIQPDNCSHGTLQRYLENHFEKGTAFQSSQDVSKVVLIGKLRALNAFLFLKPWKQDFQQKNIKTLIKQPSQK